MVGEGFASVGSASSLNSLISLLATDPTKQNAKQAAQEATLLEEIAVQHSSCYDFTAPTNPNSQLFCDLFDVLVQHRLLNDAWRGSLRPDHLLRVLQCIRLLSRDNRLRACFVSLGAVKVLVIVFKHEAAAHFAGSVSQFQIETLTEIASIIKRLAGDEGGLAALVACSVHETLTQLLNSSDPAVLPLVLVAQIGFAAHRDHYMLVANANSLDVLLRIVQQYDLPFKRLAADLLALLSRREAVVQELLALNCLGRIVGSLTTGDGSLTQSLLRVVCYMAADVGALQEMYQVGIIPVLVSLAGAAVKEMAADVRGNVIPGGSARLTELQLVCTALTRIAEADEMAYQIRQCNGVTLLGKLLIAESAPQASEQDKERAEREVSSLKTYVFRALRYLFSMERNRKVFKRLFPPDLFAVFKRLFPPDLFAVFIDVGHYNTSLAAYSELVQHFEDLSEKQKGGVSAALDDISADRDDSLRTVRGYVILEMLGKGAYGAVYKARRARGDLLVALKEIPLTDIGIFGATDAERESGVATMNKEVVILSSLSHPNIVQYYESFSEGPNLYISMELVEGVSLLDHINSLSGKGKRMPESDVWQVLIATALALNYIHVTKKIVHRDLTPGNIVLGQGPDGLRQTKIADFGLARSLTGSVCAQSIVGTMPYTCPEIIQQEHYTEKADVWSLGCVLYHIIMLKPPFDGTNPLSVASRIVEGSYEPVCDPPGGPAYSAQLKQLVRVMMTVDPNKRPSTEEVGSLIVSQLMGQLERVSLSEQRLARTLTMERAQRRGESGHGAGLASPAQRGTPQQARAPSGRLGAPWLAADAQPSSSGHASPARPVAPAARDAATPGLTARRGQLTELTIDPSGAGVAGGTGGGLSGGQSPTDGPGGPPSGGHAQLLGSFTGGGPGGRTVSIASSRLKPVGDPLTNILSQLHKVMWVEQLPPGLARDPRRRCLEAFRRLLFAPGSGPPSLKLHLAKLVACDGDMIRDGAGRSVDFGAVPDGGLGGDGAAGPGLTYDQLSQMVEGLLSDKGYYSAGGPGALVSEQELLEQLPPPSFNETVPRV
ncbi:hypothetical protein FOA52_009622 [Chlamydomonas sp. UWO 241]|nr:hypothetical protein FOA52_009622 [Chlamydomonas sp. UWO 241]